MLEWFYTVIETLPDKAWTYQALAMFCHDRHPKIALAAYGHAIACNPNQPELLMRAAGVAVKLGEWAIAKDFYYQTIGLLPNRPEGFYNLGRMADEAEENHRAVVLYSQALMRDPNSVLTYFSLGDAWGRLGDWQRALATYQATQQPQFPQVADSWARQGYALVQFGDLGGAIAAYDQALAIAPDSVKHHCAVALPLLTAGQWRRGWTEYEWRLRQEFYGEIRTECQPRWQGEDLTGKTILVRSEQGLGDTIQFCRYLPRLKAMGTRLIFRGRSPLRDLVMTVGEARDDERKCIDEFVDWDTPLTEVTYDVAVPLMSLPQYFAPEPAIAQETTEAQPVYLQVPPSTQSFKLPAPRPETIKKVGLVWASGYRDLPELIEQYRQKTCDLAALMQGIEQPDIQYYSLQVGRDVSAGEPFYGDSRLIDLSDRLTCFSETAAAIAQLDLVISVDTAVAHLAGALGKPVWILLPWAADWRWLRDRSDTVWYTSARLFRQPKLGDWESVYQAVARALAQDFLT